MYRVLEIFGFEKCHPFCQHVINCTYTLNICTETPKYMFEMLIFSIGTRTVRQLLSSLHQLSERQNAY